MATEARSSSAMTPPKQSRALRRRLTGMANDRLVDDIEMLYRSDYRRFLRVAIAILADEQLAHDAVQERGIRTGAQGAAQLPGRRAIRRLAVASGRPRRP